MDERERAAILLDVRDLRKHYPLRRKKWWRRETAEIRAVDGVSFQLRRGEMLALVGESGCGKSTLVRTLLQVERATAGEVFFAGEEVTALHGRDLRDLRRRMQMIFQDPYDALNPAMRVGQIVAEPLQVHGLSPQPHEREARVRQALTEVGLRPGADFVDRYPHELSGGQRQRVAIAAALVLEPQVLLADEPVSMLDMSIRAEIMQLLRTLCRERGIAILLISHDISAVAQWADRMAVMYMGRIVEQGGMEGVVGRPLHPYTRALLAAVPVTNPAGRRREPLLPGEPPDPAQLPAGCRFHPRCPLAMAHCATTSPSWHEAAPDHGAACHALD
jgi:oligopeptide transport system ATP-binding protein